MLFLIEYKYGIILCDIKVIYTFKDFTLNYVYGYTYSILFKIHIIFIKTFPKS